MSKELIIESINIFFEVINDDDMQENERIKSLIHALDLLAVQTYQVEFTLDENDYPDPPEQSFEQKHKETYQRIGQKFPSLGYYNVLNDINNSIANPSFSIGDAIDDITDIYNDLKDVIWYFENTSDDIALFNFDLHYQIHWQSHLRELRPCLHEWIMINT